jgi:iron-sulfur cluster insertion protein
MLITSKIKKDAVSVPTPFVTKAAFAQLSLMKKLDFTLENKALRVAIKGKECDGFTYEIFFDEKKEDDLTCTVTHEDEKIEILFDPFSAFYLQNVTINYLFDPINDLDGFEVLNPDQNKQKGKFWVQKNAKKPPMKKV